jgi:hypothetical protein
MTHGHESKALEGSEALRALQELLAQQDRPQNYQKQKPSMTPPEPQSAHESSSTPKTAPASKPASLEERLLTRMSEAGVTLDSPSLKQRLAERTQTEAAITDYLIKLQLNSFKRVLQKQLQEADATIKRDMARLIDTHTKNLETTLSSIRENASTLRQILRFSPLTLSIAAILLISLTSLTITKAVTTLSERRTLSTLSTLGLTPVRKDKEIYLLFQNEAMLTKCQVDGKPTPCIRAKTLR